MKGADSTWDGVPVEYTYRPPDFWAKFQQARSRNMATGYVYIGQL